MLGYFDSSHDLIIIALHRADIGKTNQVKRNNILKAVSHLNTIRRILQRESLSSGYATELAELREQLEATALRANMPSDLEGRITKPKAPKRPYGVKRTLIPISNRAIGRFYNS